MVSLTLSRIWLSLLRLSSALVTLDNPKQADNVLTLAAANADVTEEAPFPPSHCRNFSRHRQACKLKNQPRLIPLPAHVASKDRKCEMRQLLLFSMPGP